MKTTRETRWNSTGGQYEEVRKRTWEQQRRKPVARYEIARAEQRHEQHKTRPATRMYYILSVYTSTDGGQTLKTQRYDTETEQYAKRIANTLFLFQHGTTLYTIHEHDPKTGALRMIAQAERTRP